MNDSIQSTATQLPESVLKARARAETLVGEASRYGAAEPTISDVLRQKVAEAYSSNLDIVEPLDRATMDYLAAPQVGREKYADIFNPFARERLVSQYVGTQALPMLSLSSMYGQRVGRVEDVLGAGIRGFQAEAAGRRGEAALAQQQYQNILNEYQMTAPQQQIISAGERKFLISYDRNGNIVNKVDLGSEAGVGGLAGINQSSARSALSNDVQGYTPLETLVKKYSGILEPYEIVNTYDAFHAETPWGKHREDWDTISSWAGSGSLTPGQASNVRNSLAEDIQGDIQAGMSKEQSMTENKVLYPELSEKEFETIYNALWQETQQEGTGPNLYEPAKDWLKELLKPYDVGGIKLPKYV